MPDVVPISVTEPAARPRRPHTHNAILIGAVGRIVKGNATGWEWKALEKGGVLKVSYTGGGDVVVSK